MLPKIAAADNAAAHASRTLPNTRTCSPAGSQDHRHARAATISGRRRNNSKKQAVSHQSGFRARWRRRRCPWLVPLPRSAEMHLQTLPNRRNLLLQPRHARCSCLRPRNCWLCGLCSKMPPQGFSHVVLLHHTLPPPTGRLWTAPRTSADALTPQLLCYVHPITCCACGAETLGRAN